jgi:parvulin-like peptidyl-prolyl isomerase
MRVHRFVLALGAFFVLAAGIAACGSSVPGNSVAVMAGNPVGLQAFNHWMYVAAKGSSQSATEPVIVPNDPPSFAKCIAQARKEIPTLAKTSAATLKSDCSQLFTALSSQVMDFLIKGYWYQADAAKSHVNVTSAQVAKEFQTEKKASFPTAADFNAFLAQSGQTLSDVLYRVRVILIYQQLVKQQTKPVTAAAIASYYASHKSSFGSQETRNIRLVLAKSLADANAAKKELESGKSWNEVVKKYSTDPTTRNSGGLLTGVTNGSQDAALDQAAFAAPVNKLIGPVHSTLSGGYYDLEVTDIKPATQKSLAEATQQIRTTLTTQAQTNAETQVDAIARKNWLSQTTCRGVYAMSDCAGYKAPKTTSTGSSSTAPTTTTSSGT